jgi:hypothetical protein
MTDRPPTRRAPRLRRIAPDLIGIAWVLAAAGAVLAPALAHGSSLGPVDWLSSYGLSFQRGVAVHNRQAFDQITEMIPWTQLAWTQVHHGQLPLWNPYSALGTPLAFNWQAAPFSLPAAVGYLFPLHLAYTVQVVVTLVVAGTGAYALGRLLGVGVLGCVMGATVYELSGAFFGWLGWPMASVFSWAGWLFAAAVLAVRGGRRTRAITSFGVVVALAIYAGQPDALVLLATALGVFVAALLVLRTPGLGGSGPILRPIVDVALGTVIGVALGAPLLFPGAQLLAGSLRGAKGGSQALPPRDLMYVLFQGFDGSPSGSSWFGPSFYIRTACYVGVIAVVLAVLAVASAVGRRRRRPEVVAVTAVAVVMAALVVLPPVVLGSVQWHRALLPVDFAMAILAGVGADVLVRAPAARRTLWWMAGSFSAVGGLLLLIFGFGRGHLPSAEAAIRSRSFLWPAAQVALGLVVVAGLALMSRRAAPGAHARRSGPRTGWWAAPVLLVCETVFLVVSGSSLWSSSPAYLAPTEADAVLQGVVGSSVVGLGTSACFTPGQVGAVPDVNDAFGFREFAAYDPLLPYGYFTTWMAQTSQSPLLRPTNAIVPFSVFCPAVTNATIARRYGIGFVLEPYGATAPPGFVFVRNIGYEELYRVPGATSATLVPAPSAQALPRIDAPGSPVAVDHPDPAAWRLVSTSTGPSVLRLRLTDVPGWNATIDGRPLTMEPYSGVMLQARIPPGRHVVELRYRPTAFTVGVVVAAATVVVLVAMPVVVRLRRRTGPGALSDPS